MTILFTASHPEFGHNNLFLSDTNKNEWIIFYINEDETDKSESCE